MKEYIEREAVLQHKRKMSGADWSGPFWDEAVLCEEIRKIPAADVAPRSEVAKEIFTELEKMFCEKETPITIIAILATERYAELKKKYMEGVDGTAQ